MNIPLYHDFRLIGHVRILGDDQDTAEFIPLAKHWYVPNNNARGFMQSLIGGGFIEWENQLTRLVDDGKFLKYMEGRKFPSDCIEPSDNPKKLICVIECQGDRIEIDKNGIFLVMKKAMIVEGRVPVLPDDTGGIIKT